MCLRALAAIFIAALAVPAGAQQVDSAYTRLDLAKCPIVSTDEYGSTQWACAGYGGVPVYVAEGDLRFFVSYGAYAAGERAAQQTLPRFNHVHSTLEWRLERVGDAWRPFATILRWIEHGDAFEREGQTLVVTRLEPGNTCHVAYIDVRRTPDANTVARELADWIARDFDCANDAPAFVPG